MKTESFNTKGEKAEVLELPEKIFGVAWKPALVKQVYEGERRNQRIPWAHARTRGEVSGGGRKPWRQKGTGRARHGSTRSPLWVGGGKAHGPRNARDYSVKINKKMKRGALFSLLSRKLKEKEVVLMDNFGLTSAKTKEVFTVFKNLRSVAKVYRIGEKGGKAILAVPREEKVLRASRNLQNISYVEPRNLNVAEVLHNKYLLLDRSSVEELTKIYTHKAGVK